MLQRELHEHALRETIDAELTKITLQPAHHDRLEILLPLDRHAAREPDGVEDLEERAEGGEDHENLEDHEGRGDPEVPPPRLKQLEEPSSGVGCRPHDTA